MYLPRFDQHRRFRLVRVSRVQLIAPLTLILFLLAGCEDFYTSDPTPTPGITPTPGGPVGIGDGAFGPEDIAIAFARDALAQRLAIPPDQIIIDNVRGDTWSSVNSGCFPLPEDRASFVLIPGLIVSMFHGAHRYEYHSDVSGGTALRRRTLGPRVYKPG